MGSFYLILGLVFSLIIAIIALANNETVVVSYIFGRSEVSLILLILGSAVTGALAMGLFSLFRSIRHALSYRDLRHQKESLQKQLKDLEEENIYLQAALNRAVSVPEEEEVETPAEGSEPQPGETLSAEDEVDEEPS